MRKIFQTKVLEKIRTHNIGSIIFFLGNRDLWDNVEKYDSARQATDDNIIRGEKKRSVVCMQVN